jgi:membrane-bound lytic murein transglycosylase D
MHNEGYSRGLRRFGTVLVFTSLALLSMAGCSSFPKTETPAAAQPAPIVTPEPTLAPIVVPHIPLRAPIVPAETDVVARIRAGLVLAGSTHASVQRELAWYARNQAYVDRVFGRADRFLFHIVEALEARNMPLDLALLPIVESAFDPFAYSHGRASGLWQIIPATGRRLGVKQNWWYDGRRDVPESTRAALDYLQDLHRQFGGDWLLAIAGYNSGEGNVARALRRAKADGRALDFWGIQRYLPAETRTYVPRLLAIRELVADPAQHGITLPRIANKPTFVEVDTRGQIDMALAARLVGVEASELYAWNAGVNRWATDPEGPHRLLLPVSLAPAFSAALADLGERELMQWSRHRVKQGETIGGIAEQYHTTAAVLREVNELRGNLIRAGDYLLIPHATQSLANYTQTADARAARQQNRERPGARGAHVVRSGDTLWSISRQYGVNMRQLASWNAMAPGDVLSVGRELVVWTETADSTAAVVEVASESRAALPAAAAAQVRQVTYVVRRGDSLYSIAQRFRVTVANLLEWNKVSAQQYLQPGQRLVMYVNVREQST